MGCNCTACRKYRFRKFASWRWWREAALFAWRQARFAVYMLRSRRSRRRP